LRFAVIAHINKLAGIGLDVGAVDTDRAHFQKANFPRQQQNLLEAGMDGDLVNPAKRCDGVGVGVRIPCQIPYRHVTVRCPLNLAATEDAVLTRSPNRQHIPKALQEADALLAGEKKKRLQQE